MVLQGALFMIVSRLSAFVVHRPGWREWLFVAMSFVLAAFFLTSCSGLDLGDNPANTTENPIAPQVALAQLHWCGKPVMIFRDEGVSTPTSGTVTATTAGTPIPSSTATNAPSTAQPVLVTNWSQVEPQLGFTVFLPQALPQNTCLVSASGTLHDPIFGGSFTIGYLLPDHSSLTLAEAPFRSQNRQFQCTPSSSSKASTPVAKSGPAQAILQVCSGVQDNTSIVFSARGSTDNLQRFFASLQSDINWVPGS
jgi:hypothetical protein